MIGVAILGHGVVGSGVAELLMKNEKKIASSVGQPLYLKRILDLRDFDVPYADRFTKNFEDILKDPDIRVCAEVMGGVHPAYEFSKQLLAAGISVVTSNKELVAYKGAELLALAREHGVNYYFEASVGGGVPLIHPIYRCLAANHVEEIAGILNGTTNYILTKMLGEGVSFEEALANAQKLGYAEKDPTADVEGHDACRKICILAALAYGKHVYPESVFTEGITKITEADAQYAKSCGRVLKLIGRVKRLENGKLLCMVSPAMVNQQSQLANIQDVFNGILVRGDATGDVLFYGKGAGKMPTASAVVADMMDAALYPQNCPSLYWEDDGVDHVENHLETTSAYYLRVQGEHAEKELSEVFGSVSVLHREDALPDEAAVLIDPMCERDFQNRLEELRERHLSVLGQIRLLDY